MKLLYFFYIVKNTDFKLLHLSITHLMHLKNWSYLKVVFKVLNAYLKYNTTFAEYFDFEFHRRSEQEKAEYIHPLYLYRFQKKMNHAPSRIFFKKKNLFLEKFHEFIDHEYFLPFESDVAGFKLWLDQHVPKTLILKNSVGFKGIGVEKVSVRRENEHYFFNDMDIKELYSFIKKRNLDLIEIGIEQHSVLKEIYSKSLNTVRIMTLVNTDNSVHILGAVQRIGTMGYVDNFSAKGVAATIDLQTGIIKNPLVCRDFRIQYEDGRHPVTGKNIIGTALPYWEELKEMVTKAALVIPLVRTVGWDVAITETGPYLLEGNDNWSQNVWQKTSGKGRKADLDIFLT